MPVVNILSNIVSVEPSAHRSERKNIAQNILIGEVLLIEQAKYTQILKGDLPHTIDTPLSQRETFVMNSLAHRDGLLAQETESMFTEQEKCSSRPL